MGVDVWLSVLFQTLTLTLTPNQMNLMKEIRDAFLMELETIHKLQTKSKPFLNIPLILSIGFRRPELATDLLIGVMSCRLRLVSENGIRTKVKVIKRKTDVS